jgi:hypothetical protein
MVSDVPDMLIESTATEESLSTGSPAVICHSEGALHSKPKPVGKIWPEMPPDTMATEESLVPSQHRSSDPTCKATKGNTVSAETKDSSSAGDSVPTDKRYCWPFQNDSVGEFVILMERLAGAGGGKENIFRCAT